MKNRIRVRKNRSAVKPASQVKTPAAQNRPKPKSVIPAHQEGEFDLVLFSEQDGQFAGINLTDEEFATLRHSAAKQNLSLEKLLVIGFKQMVNPLPTPSQQMKLRELEFSIDAAAVLLGMITKDAESGLKTLTDHAILKLHDDFAAVRAAFKTPAAESIEAFGGGQ